MRFVGVMLTSSIILITLILPGPLAHADEGDIEILSADIVSEFPEGVSFSLTIRSPDPIDEVRVFYKSEGSQASSYNQLEFEPGQQVKAHYFLHTTGSGESMGSSFVPPGTIFNYFYEIRDQAGRVMRTDEENFIYMDTRFDWNSISEGPLTVYHYGPTEKRAKTILQSGLQAVVKMSTVLEVEKIKPITIIAYNNYRHMLLALPPRAQAVREDLVTQGQAFTKLRVLLVLAFEPTIAGITSHEITHVIVDDAAGRAYSVVPAWLNEGLAEYGNIEPTESYDNALIYGIYTRRIKPLGYLLQFSGEPDDIVIAYGQSRSVVSYLLNTYGPKQMAKLMRTLDTTLSIDQALLESYGFDQHGLDTEWRSRIGIQPPISPKELPSVDAAIPTPTPDSVSGLPATPGPERAEEKKRRAAPGCNQRSSSDLGIGVDPFVILLLTSPVGLISLRRSWKRHDGQ